MVNAGVTWKMGKDSGHMRTQAAQKAVPVQFVTAPTQPNQPTEQAKGAKAPQPVTAVTTTASGQQVPIVAAYLPSVDNSTRAENDELRTAASKPWRTIRCSRATRFAGPLCTALKNGATKNPVLNKDNSLNKCASEFTARASECQTLNPDCDRIGPRMDSFGIRTRAFAVAGLWENKNLCSKEDSERMSANTTGKRQ